MANNFRVAGFVLGLAIKAPCNTVSLVNVASLTGIGQNIGGWIVGAYDRVLLAAQSNPIDNGIYSVRTSAWIRDGDCDGNRDLVGGTLVPVWVQAATNITLYRLEGPANAKTIGVDALVFSAYYDPGAPGGGEDLQATTVLGNTTDQGIEINDGSSLIVRETGDVDTVTILVDAAVVAPFTTLSFSGSGGIEGYQFDEDVNVDGDVFVGTSGRLAFYRKGDSVSHSIQGSGSDIFYQAVVGVHRFQGNIELLDNTLIQFGTLPNDASLGWDGTNLVFNFNATNRIVRSLQGAEWQFTDETETNFVSIQYEAGAGIIATDNVGVGPIDFRPGGIGRFRVGDINFNGVSSGAAVARADGNLEPVGFNSLYIEDTNPVSFTIAAEQCGSVTLKTNTTPFTITCEGSGASDFHLEGVHHIINAGASGDITLADGGEALILLDGASATDVGANLTIGPGAMVSLFRAAADTYYVWGLGITP